MIFVRYILLPSVALAFAVPSSRRHDSFVTTRRTMVLSEPMAITDSGIIEADYSYEESDSQWAALLNEDDSEPNSLDEEETREVTPEPMPKKHSKSRSAVEECLDSFGVPYDLEDIDASQTMEDELAMTLHVEKPSAPTSFCREIGVGTLLVGLSPSVLRDVPHAIHERTVDDVQVDWFEQLLKEHPSRDGWKIFVFTHLPPDTPGIFALQDNGCCWLNHSNSKKDRKFIELVREHRCIKAWFSGHLHLRQDWQVRFVRHLVHHEDTPGKSKAVRTDRNQLERWAYRC